MNRGEWAVVLTVAAFLLAVWIASLVARLVSRSEREPHGS